MVDHGDFQPFLVAVNLGYEFLLFLQMIFKV
jgi:hypothetical protein